MALLKQPDQHSFTGFRDFDMLSLILDSGLRVGEMTKLKLNQVDIKESQLLGVIGKSKKPRDISFCDDVRKLLLSYLKARGDLPSQHCFVTLDGRPLGVRSFQATLRKYGESAEIKGVRVSPHTLRHTFAKIYILNEGDPYSLQDILGHTSQDMVKRYVNLGRPRFINVIREDSRCPIYIEIKTNKNGLTNGFSLYTKEHPGPQSKSLRK